MIEAQIEDHIFHRTLKTKWQQIDRGEGVYLFDTEGQRYLDACAGVHVVSIGHGVKEIADVMREQASQICFTYSRFLSRPQIDLAEKIAAKYGWPEKSKKEKVADFVELLRRRYK